MSRPDLAGKTVLITGVHGFVGFHVAQCLRRAGAVVLGADRPKGETTREIYRVRARLLRARGIETIAGNLRSRAFVADMVGRFRPQWIVHLAANANVRDANKALFAENVVAMQNMLDAASANPPAHFVYASSSSVYGKNKIRPFCESAPLPPPLNPYAKSKIACEALAADHAQRAKFPVTGVRFFNVYGPWGRPEMAPFQFADALATGRPAPIINGDTSRSWLYIDDAVAALVALAKTPPAGGRGARIVNAAGPRLVQTMDALYTIARQMGKTPRIEQMPKTMEELKSNPANMDLHKSLIGFLPQTDFENGIEKFLAWHGDEWLPLLAPTSRAS